MDDVGNSDVGFTIGSAGRTLNIHNTSLTPNVDAIAMNDGIILNNHITHFYCTPSRASFLTGRVPMHVQQGQAFPETPSSGIPRNMSTFANLLSDTKKYENYYFGKWDVGISTPTHTPSGRGFKGKLQQSFMNSSLSFAEHMIESFTQQVFPGGTACNLLDPNITDLWAGNGPAIGINGTNFIEELFVERVISTITTINTTEDPMNTLIVWAPKVIHYPLMVPEDTYNQFSWMDSTTDETWCNATTPYIYPSNNSESIPYSCRRQGWSLLSYFDQSFANVIQTIKSIPNLWESTLLIVSSDNGSPLDLSEAGGNNYPLRGAKYSVWQGGIKVPAFVSGGYIPSNMRGTSLDQLVHISDWYSTIAYLAGVDPTDHKAEAAGLPPIDSLNLWPLLSGQNSTSPRVEIPVSPDSIISWPYKLVRGLSWWSGRTGSVYPNSSSTDPNADPDVWVDCGNGCLYDLSQDTEEYTNLAEVYPSIVSNLSTRLDQLVPNFFTNNDTGIDICPNGTLLCGCYAAINIYKGYFGPYQY